MTQCIIHGNAGADERGGVRRRKLVWDSRKRILVCKHDFGVSAVCSDSRYFLIQAVHEVATSARYTLEIRSAEISDSDTLTNAPAGDAIAERIDCSDDLVAGHARIHNVWGKPQDRDHVRVTHSARLHANAHAAVRRRCEITLDQLELPQGADLNGAIRLGGHRRYSLIRLRPFFIDGLAVGRRGAHCVTATS